MKLRSLSALAAAALLVAGLAGCSSSTPTDSGTFAVDSNTLVFGVVPDSASTQTNYQPLMDYIAKETGLKVQYKESTDYAALIEAAVAGQLDVASFSGFTYVTALKNGAALTPISSIVTVQGQQPGYYSEAIVPKGSSIKTLADFKGHKVCFVSPTSTSGYLFPSYNLLKAGVNPATDITPVFAGKHDVSVQKVGVGTECEAGFAEDSEVAKSSAVTVIDKTMVPGAPIVMSSNLPQATKDKLTSVLSNVTIDQIIAAGISGANSDGFKATFYSTQPVTDSYYDTIRSICKTVTTATQCQ